MLRRGKVDVASEGIEQLRAVQSEPGHGAKCAFLQILVRVESCEHLGLVAVDNAGAKIFGAAGFLFQLEELIAAFCVRRNRERRPECGRGRSKGLRYLSSTGGRIFRPLRSGARERRGSNLRSIFLRRNWGPRKTSRTSRSYFASRSRDQRIDERESGAREDRRHASE